jgi:2-dehydropantoate 2-reductase
MHFAIVGAGAVGGFYGAKLVQAGHRVTFIARGSHLAAMRADGLRIESPLGDFRVPVEATGDAASVGQVDVAVLAVKTYDNRTALPLLRPLVGEHSIALTLQNGVDSSGEVAEVIGRERVLGGATYVATALVSPGVIVQTGTHRRIVFGEVFGQAASITPRVARIGEVLSGADIQSEPVADARVPLWEKFIYLAPFAGFTGAARLPAGAIWGAEPSREQFLAAVQEVTAVALAEGIAVGADLRDRIVGYMDALPPATRSSLLIDLSQGKPIEVEALLGAVVRRAKALGLAVPVMSTLYAVLAPHARGRQ